MINMAVNDEEEMKHNYIIYGLAVAILALIVAVAKFIIDIYYNPKIAEYMKPIIVLIIFIGIGFVYIILQQEIFRRELKRLKSCPTIRLANKGAHP